MLRDDASDKGCGRYIKGGIPTVNARCRNPMFTHVRHFTIGSHLNYDMIPAGYLQIDGSQRCSHIERHAMVFGHHCYLIGANFIGRITIGSHLDEITDTDEAVKIMRRHY